MHGQPNALPSDPPARRALVLLAVMVVLSVALRWPGFAQGGFASHDVAGILYNAMLLRRGGLPYVDDIELKAPGTFYLAAVLAGSEGRDIAAFQIWANASAIVGMLVVAALAWRMWGTRAAIVAAAVYGTHDALLDSMDANYVTWAHLPQLVGLGLGLEAMRSERPRLRTAAWVVAGGLVGVATLMKRPAGIGLPILLIWALWPGGTTLRRARDSGAIVLGYLLAHVPIALHYASRGAFDDLVLGYLFNPWGGRYVEGGREVSWLSAWDMVAAPVHFLAVPVALAGFALARDRLRDPRAAMLIPWLVATLVATTVGLRFYKGYFLGVLPPLCLLAAMPVGLFGSERPRTPRWVLVPLLLLFVRHGAELANMRFHRARAADAGARKLAKRVLEYTVPGDTIWVWGWHLWDLYPLTGHLSGSRIYKSLGLLTPPNDDTWRIAQSKMEFTPGMFADALMLDLEASHPACVVLGSTVPHTKFRRLKTFLFRHYRRDRVVKVGRVQLWRRKELKPPEEREPTG